MGRNKGSDFCSFPPNKIKQKVSKGKTSNLPSHKHPSFFAADVKSPIITTGEPIQTGLLLTTLLIRK